MSYEFALFLGGALVLGAVLSWVQHRAYSATVRRLASQFGGQAVSLVSGRGKGVRRGALVVLAVDERSKKIVAAQAMKGATVFARFRPCPELLGPLSTAVSRTNSVPVEKALEEAQKQYRQISRTLLSRKGA
jgi:DNA-binding transcriptional regulator of glucitol operon